MWFECEQPFLSGERCVTSRKTAAKDTNLCVRIRPFRPRALIIEVKNHKDWKMTKREDFRFVT